jgi:dipeptidyl aminopeptidase/acylaminoacyl peptidase
MRFVLILLTSGALLAQRQTFDVAMMLSLSRVSEPALSPNGKQVVFTVETVDVDKNIKPKQIYVVPIAGGPPVQLTHEGTDNERPRWSADSELIYFVSDRSGSSQIWVMDNAGGHTRQITNLSTEAAGILVSPNGKKIVFESSVFPECSADDKCNRDKLDAEAKNKVKAKIYTSLLYRHWTAYETKRRQHLLVVDADGSNTKDLTPGPHDVPPFSLGGPDDYTISPDSNEVAFTMNVDPEPATSTNSDIYTVPIAGGEIRKITIGMGADSSPLYSPDGKLLAFRSQARAGYESDRWRLIVLDRATGKVTNLTEALDRWVGGMTWLPDSERLVFTSEDRGRTGLQMISVSGGGLRPIISGASTLDDVQFTPDGETMIYTQQSGSKPVEIFKATAGSGTGIALTHFNDATLANSTVRPLEELKVEDIQSFLVKPPDFSPMKKYPVLFLIHGGPQGSWGETWSYRWNPQVFASAGYLVVMPNPRGSTGYGQKFIDDINGDWGGKAYDDIMAVADKVAALPYVDVDRMAAAGGSFGGYMIDWILGHTNRFKALVSHSGVYDLRSMAGETEELWFPAWEFKGMPWDNPDMYAKWSPSFFANNFKTPTLVLHGELDYRVPVGQGMQLFTALQLQKVPSKIVLFPDEGHWISKPQNSVLWYGQFLEWVGEWLKKPSN